jgi:hypothetical protein
MVEYWNVWNDGKNSETGSRVERRKEHIGRKNDPMPRCFSLLCGYTRTGEAGFTRSPHPKTADFNCSVRAAFLAGQVCV